MRRRTFAPQPLVRTPLAHARRTCQCHKVDQHTNTTTQESDHHLCTALRTNKQTDLDALLCPQRRRQRYAWGERVLSQVDPPIRPQADERPLYVPERLALVARRRAVHREVQPGEPRTRRCVRVPLEREKCPVVEPVPLHLLSTGGREHVLRVPAVEVRDVGAREAELGDGLGERDGVMMVDAFPGQSVEEERIAEKQLLFDFRVGLCGETWTWTWTWT